MPGLIRCLRTPALVAALTLGLWACSDDGAQSDAGVPPTDGPGGADTGPRPDGKGDGTTRDGKIPGSDAEPDAKQSARWKVFPGPNPGFWEHTATVLQNSRVLLAGGFRKDTGVVSLNASFLFLPVAGTFQGAGAMATPRAEHTATLLDDGRVLVAGGAKTYSTFTETCELFDPSKTVGTGWSATGSMFAPRVNHAAVKLKDGRVLVVGGYNSADKHLNSLEIYDPKSGTWTAPTAKMSAPRVLATATLLQSGKVLIAGGFSGGAIGAFVYQDTLSIFDPAAGTIKAVPGKMGSKRSHHTATLLSDGRVLLVGGTCGTGCTVSGAEIYDPTTNKVTSINHPGGAPEYHAACALKDGRVLVVGGGYAAATKATIFSPAGGGGWSQAPGLTHGRHDHTCSTLGDGTVLVAGGKGGTPGTWDPPVGFAERFYP